MQFPSPVREKVSRDATDEGLTIAIRTSSPCSAGTFSFKEKGVISVFFNLYC